MATVGFIRAKTDGGTKWPSASIPFPWKVRYRDGRAGSHAEATDKLRKLQAELLSGRLTIRTKGTVASFLDEGVENAIKPNRANATYRQYRWIIDQRITLHLGKKRIEEVRRLDIQKLVAVKASQTVQSRAKEGGSKPDKELSRSTLRLIRAILHTAFKDATHDGLVSVNPASHIELPKEVKKAPVSLKQDQDQAFLRAAGESDMPEFWHFLFMTGTRLGEASGLRWQAWTSRRARPESRVNSSDRVVNCVTFRAQRPIEAGSCSFPRV